MKIGTKSILFGCHRAFESKSFYRTQHGFIFKRNGEMYSGLC